MRLRQSLCAVLLILALTSLAAWARPPSAGAGPVYRASIAPWGHADADFDGGGAFRRRSLDLRASVERALGPRTQLALGLDYDYSRYRFRGGDPWNDIHRLGVSPRVIQRLGDGWSTFVAVPVSVAAEDAAFSADALRYGAIAVISRQFSPRLMVGLGAAAFRGLEDPDAFPFVSVRWRITDAWRLANPQGAGAVSPAGVELTYAPAEAWEIAAGAAWQSSRFRVDAGDGIGDVSSTPVYLRYTRALGERLRLDVQGGALLNGRVSLADEDGRRLAADDFETTPFVGVNVAGRF